MIIDVVGTFISPSPWKVEGRSRLKRVVARERSQFVNRGASRKSQ